MNPVNSGRQILKPSQFHQLEVNKYMQNSIHGFS